MRSIVVAAIASGSATSDQLNYSRGEERGGREREKVPLYTTLALVLSCVRAVLLRSYNINVVNSELN